MKNLLLDEFREEVGEELRRWLVSDSFMGSDVLILNEPLDKIVALAESLLRKSK